MGNIVSNILNITSNVYAYITYEKTEDISIHGEFIKVPYVYENKRYYVLVPIHHEEDKTKRILSLLKTEPNNSIYFNNIIECILTMKNTDDLDEDNDMKKQEINIDITNELERYMGPDQIYKDHTNKIKLRDILPRKYHNDFNYITIMYDDLETLVVNDLDFCIFEERNM
jgi:hypothetical protein